MSLASWREEEFSSEIFTQQAIPLTIEAARSIIKRTVQRNIVSVPTLPDELNLSKRRAEAVLHQPITNCSPLVADFYHRSNKDDVKPYNPVCSACPHGLNEAIEHLILQCPDRGCL